MVAITGEPVPDGLRADAVFSAEYEEAAADLLLLRQQLGILADELTAEPEPEPEPEPKPVPEREPSPAPAAARPAPRPPLPRHTPHRARRFAFGALATAAAACFLAGMAWLFTQAGNGVTGGASSDSAARQADGKGAVPSFSVCGARLVVEGDIRTVEHVPGSVDQFRVTLRVTRSYRPAKTPAVVTFLADGTNQPRPRVGLHVLVGIAEHANVPDLWVTGTRRIAARWAELLTAPDGTQGADGGCS
ncbi:hypothetical protein WN71_002610 [Streptomyces mangrovisoli]|uniref:Uncharacterized protein n=2 Tax=Streptomyces mangrovisoli TaxID=1428628 RepID=A0A1J4P6W2_9ACTN|nr:hypothetical protein WN71_002610 [Streptomyces mangrovisoli]